MLTRKLLLTTVLCGGLFVAAGTSGVHTAMGATLLQPNSDWAVTSLAATQAGGHPYCALARRFSNNLIFTIARNSQDESSVAIDFQKNALNNTQTYYVVLKPGFGQDRAFNVRPVSGKALVIRLGQDYAFHDALNRSGKLELEMAGEAYSFNISDFSEGQKRLGECLVNLVEPAAGGSSQASMTPVPPPAAVAPQKRVQEKSSYILASGTASPPPATVQAEHIQDSGEAQSLKEENTRLRNALERERRNYEERYMLESQSSSVAAELNEKVRLLDMENRDLRQQLTYKPAPAEPMVCPAPDAGATAALESELLRLKQENITLKANGNVSATLEKDLTALRAENLRLKQAGNTGNAALENELALLKQENIRLKTSGDVSAALETELSALREENLRLKQQGSSANVAVEGEIASLRNENLRLKQDIAAQQAKTTLLEKQIAEKSVPDSTDAAITDALRQRVSVLENENRDLKTANAAAAKGGGDINVSLAQLRSIEEQLRLVEQDRNKLLKQLEAVDQGKRDSLLDISSDNWDLEQATRRFNEAEREIQRLARQLDEQRTQCSTEKKELEYMLFDPSMATQEQISKLIQLEDKVASAQAVLDEQKAGYELKLAELAQQTKGGNKELEIANAEYKEKLAVLEKEMASRGNVSEEARTRIASLESELATLQQKSRSAETALGVQKAEHQQKVAMLTQEMASKGDASEASAARIAALQTEVAASETKAIEAEKALRAQQTEFHLKQAEYQQKLAGLQQQLASKGNADQAAQQRIATLEGELASLSRVKGEAEMALANAKAAHQQQLASLQRDAAAVQTASAELDAVRREKDVLMQQKASAEAENAQLDTKIASLELQLAEIQTAAGEPTPDPAAEARILQLVQDNEKLVQERDVLKVKQADLSGKIASLESALASIPTGSGGTSVASSVVAGKAPIQDFDYGSGTDSQYKDFGSSVQKTVEPAVSASGALMTASSLQTILGRAQIPAQGLEQTDADESGVVSYSWDTGTLFGSAEQRSLANAGQFDKLAEAYIEKTRSRCQGEFAAVPVMSDQSGPLRVSAYEIACIAGAEGASASIVFQADKGKFTAIAHETGLDGMEEAMDVRDRLVSVLMQTQIVSR